MIIIYKNLIFIENLFIFKISKNKILILFIIFCILEKIVHFLINFSVMNFYESLKIDLYINIY